MNIHGCLIRLRDDYAFSSIGADYTGPLYAKNVFAVC